MIKVTDDNVYACTSGGKEFTSQCFENFHDMNGPKSGKSNMMLLNFGYEDEFWADPAIIPLDWNLGNWKEYSENHEFKHHGSLDNFYVRYDTISSLSSPFVPLNEVEDQEIFSWDWRTNLTTDIMRKIKIANNGYCPLNIGCVSTLDQESPFV